MYQCYTLKGIFKVLTLVSKINIIIFKMQTHWLATCFFGSVLVHQFWDVSFLPQPSKLFKRTHGVNPIKLCFYSFYGYHWKAWKFIMYAQNCTCDAVAFTFIAKKTDKSAIMSEKEFGEIGSWSQFCKMILVLKTTK